MSTYTGTVTITVGITINARSQREAEVVAMESVFARITPLTNPDDISQRSYDKTVELEARRG